MTVSLDPPIIPKNGHTIKILSVRRVSCPGPGKQDIRSLDDQGALHERWIKDYIDQPYEIKVIEGSGSGEHLDRAEYLELLDQIETSQWDLVITEDLGRIARRMEAYLCCEQCEETQTRLISINDNVDTAREDWQDPSIMATWHHSRSNRDLSKRIKRTQRNRFLHGGVAAIPIFGYLKKPGAKSDADWEKVPEAEPIYKEWFDRLDKGTSFSQVADWLNKSGVPTGPYCKNEKWDCAMVSRVTRNWLLKGVRFRNKRKSRRHRKGYRSEKAKPEELLTRDVPHLAFFDAAYYDRVVAKVDKQNAMYSRTRNGGPDPCANRPKNRIRFPGQTIYCGICGRKFVFGGHGRTKCLMCAGAREHKCWNGATINGELTAKNISEAVFAEIEKLPGFDSTFLSMVNEEADRLDADREIRLKSLDREIAKVKREIDNVVKFIRSGDASERVRADLHNLEEKEKQLLYEKNEIERTPSNAVEVPSVEELKRIARETFDGLALDSPEFARHMRKLTGRIYVYPFRLCDSNKVVLRAKFQLQLANLLLDQRLQESLRRPLEIDLKVDLYEPPQRVVYREEIIALRKEMTEKKAAKLVGITITAAQKASALNRLMEKLGIADPYIIVTEPPADSDKIRRHKNERYKFDPLPDIPSW